MANELEGTVDASYRQLCSDLTLQTKKDGFFKDFLAAVTEKLSVEEFTSFSQLKDDKARIQFCWNLDRVHEVIRIQKLFKGKSTQESLKKRELGNEHFREKDYGKALMTYSQAVICAPYIDSDTDILEDPQLALGLANRSAVLVSLKEYNLAISDIQLALQNGYPEQQKYKLYERMGFCYSSLKDCVKALVAYKVALQCLEKSQLDPAARAKWKQTIESGIAKLENGKSQSEAKTELKNNSETPKLYRGSNPYLPNASAAVSIDYQGGMGRFAKAAEEIKPGLTVAVEKPYAACLLPEKFGTHCHHCFLRVVAPVGCPHCRSVAFCGSRCRDEALRTYHKYECLVLDILIASGMSILSFVALRIFTQQKVEYFLEYETLIQEGQDNRVPTANNVYNSMDYTSIYNLVTLGESRSQKDFFDRAVMAVFLMKCLRETGYFGIHSGNSQQSNNEIFVGSLLLRHLQQLQFNAHEIHEFFQPQENTVRGSSSKYIGVGIYPTVAFFNHSCYPGVTRYFIGSTVVIRSNRTIRRGEMVAENYGPIFTHKSLEDRQLRLKGRYWFDCKCQPCQEDWGTYDYLPPLDRSLPASCVFCDRTIHMDPNRVMTYVKCSWCKKQMQTAMARKKTTELTALYQTGFDAMDKAQVRQAVQLFSLFISSVEDLAQPPIRELHLAQEALRLCLAAYGTRFCPATHPAAIHKRATS